MLCESLPQSENEISFEKIVDELATCNPHVNRESLTEGAKTNADGD